MKETV